MNDDARGVVRAYYAIAGLYTLAASLIWGVNTLFLLDAGLSFFEVFAANAAFSAGMVVFEIPTGVVADTLGRRVSFLLSVAVLAATTLGYLAAAEIGGGLAAFLMASVFMGLGFTFYSGAVEAWLVDAIRDAGYDDELDSVFARGQMLTGAAMLVGSVGGGVLGQLDLSVPFLVRTALLVALLAFAAGRMHDRGFTPRRLTARQAPAEIRTVARQGVAFGWRRPDLRALFLAGFAQTAFFTWGWYAQQPYLLDLLGRDAVWVAGVVSALVSLSMMAGNGMVEWFTRFCGRRTTILLWAAAAQALGAAGVGIADSFALGLAAFLVVTTAMGVAMPVNKAYVHTIVPSAQRATVVSFDSMVSGVGGVGGQLSLGAVGGAQTVGTAFVAGGGIAALALPFLARVRSVDDPADHFRGRRAGVEATTACQGLPEIATVEPQPRPRAATP